MNWLDKLERKFGKIYIPNLMLVITIGTGILYLICMATGSASASNLFVLSPDAVMHGQIWRLITFIFVPSESSPIFLLITLYFYYWAGSSLEKTWGEFKFNVYYLIGMIATIIISFIVRVPVNGQFINLSLFLAFAKMYPDMQILFMFIIPVKVKYLGYFNWALILIEAISYIYTGHYIYVLYALIPVINYLIFFVRSNYKQKKMQASSVIRMKDYKKKVQKAQKSGYIHKCEVCGITDKDDSDMEFRYCSKCKGKHCYCEKHITNHNHIE